MVTTEYNFIHQLKEKLKNNVNAFSKKAFFESHLTSEEKNIINSFIGDTIGEKIYNFVYDIKERPKCVCKNDLKFFSFKEGYRKYCSRHCKAVSLKHTPEQISKMKKSLKKTMTKKYGVENPFQLDSVKEKIKNSRDKTWYQNRKEKIIKTNNEKYGTDWAMQDETVKKKSYNSQLKRYGAIFGGKQAENRSKNEIKIFEFIKSLGLNPIHNTRSIIKPYELDIYIPDLKIAIEYNGDYWHSVRRVRHKIKLDACKEKGIKLIQIWESDFLKYEEDILKNIEKVIFNKPLDKSFFIFYEKDGHHYQNAEWPPQQKYICLTEENKRFFNENEYSYDCGSYLLD